MTGEHVEFEKRLDTQKVAVAWLVYAATLGILLLVSFFG
jgi:hypothetical protein